ncbi:MAG: arylamine N-acetyltransferase family protein [Cellvibrionaceae bacterium]
MTDNRTTIARSYLQKLELEIPCVDDLDSDRSALKVDFLNQLQSRHIAQFSFNSLAVVLGQELPLDLASLFEKIVIKGRGGYCFEHNKLIFNVLETMGFDVRLLLARVTYNRDVDSARTHRVTLVTLGEDQYIVDGGFGHLGARKPVKLTLGLEQIQGSERFRIIKDTSQLYYHYQVFKDGDFFTLYTFDFNHYTEADCSVGHFYSHRHPDAAFVNNLVICRKYSDRIDSLRNDELHRVDSEGTSITKLSSSHDLHQALTGVFEIEVDVAISEFLFSKFSSS